MPHFARSAYHFTQGVVATIRSGMGVASVLLAGTLALGLVGGVLWVQNQDKLADMMDGETDALVALSHTGGRAGGVKSLHRHDEGLNTADEGRLMLSDIDRMDADIDKTLQTLDGKSRAGGAAMEDNITKGNGGIPEPAGVDEILALNPRVRKESVIASDEASSRKVVDSSARWSPSVRSNPFVSTVGAFGRSRRWGNRQPVRPVKNYFVRVQGAHPAATEDTESFALQSVDIAVLKRPGIQPVSAAPIVSGRPDPFAPLITKPSEQAMSSDELEENPQSIQLTGVIGNPKKGNAVVILQITDNASGTARTLVKRQGDTFDSNGQKINVKSVDSDSVIVTVDGEVQTIPLNAFVDTVNTTSTAGGGNAPGTSGVGALGVPGTPGAPGQNEVPAGPGGPASPPAGTNGEPFSELRGF